MSKKKANKKNFKILKKIGRGIYRFLDKIIVTPISAIIYRLSKFWKKYSGVFEVVFNKPYSLLLASLLIAVLFFIVVDSRAINLVETESEIISSQPVSVLYNEEKYVVEGIPETVDIILMGRKSDLYLAKQLGEHKVVLDLNDYKTGQYTVKLKYNHSVESVTYNLMPGTVTVKISEKVSHMKELKYDLLNQDKLDKKLNVNEVNLNETEVYIKGSSETLAKVATVKALVDVSTLNLSEAGTTEIDKLPIVAYDENGKLVENVEVVPSTASGTIKVDSYHVDLPVKVVPVGTFATGFAIASAKSSVTTVRVYGDQAELSKLSYIAAEIDVDGLNADKKFIATLSKPSGVRSMSENTTSVEVKVDREATREIEVSSIEAINLSSQYSAGAVNQEAKCVVILKGVQSVIDNIQPSSVRAYVDLTGYGLGTFDVDVQVEGQDLTVTYTPQIKKIQIKITSNTN